LCKTVIHVNRRESSILKWKSLKLAKYKPVELDLDEEEHNDMHRIAETIEGTQRDQLDIICWR